MASERQIEANRRARNSTGARSTSGKKRASGNAFRHGLTKPISSAEFEHEVEKLAGQIAGDTEDRVPLELARDAAAADLQLARVRRVKAALIDRMAAFGRFDVPNRFASPKDELAWILQQYFGATLRKGRPKFAEDPLPAMPSQEPPRTAEAMRPALPDLVRFKPLRIPGRYAPRPRHPLDRKESTYPKNTLKL